MTASTDGFTSPTLKHVRESWWDDDFTDFLRETLKPRSGNRILDVGCGRGLAQVNIGRLHISQIRLVGIDLVVSKVIQARQKTASHNLRAGFAAADACHVPFADGVFDSLFCVAVLQHIGDVRAALGEFARVTAPNGRIVAVEPDNSKRYMFSSVPSGRRAFEQAEKFFDVVTLARKEKADPAIGPKLPSLFAEHGIEPIEVRLFPVAHITLGAMPAHVWATRRDAIRSAMKQVSSAAARDAGQAYLDALDGYEADAATAGPTFVEIQNTMLFAAVGQRT